MGVHVLVCMCVGVHGVGVHVCGYDVCGCACVGMHARVGVHVWVWA